MPIYEDYKTLILLHTSFTDVRFNSDLTYAYLFNVTIGKYIYKKLFYNHLDYLTL